MVKYIVEGFAISCLFHALTVQAQQDPTAPLGWQKNIGNHHFNTEITAVTECYL